MASQDWFDKDFYAILGVPSDADAATIKKTYRKLARKLHPDPNPGDAKAEERFKEIGEAYAVLSDPEQRQRVRRDPRHGAGGARFTAGGPAAAAAGGFEDVFGGMFGQGRRRPPATCASRHRRRPASPTSRTCSADVRQGGRSGPAAAASAASARRPGRDAAPTSRRTTTLGFRHGGRGRHDHPRASTAGAVTTRIPAGVTDGQKIRLRGKGAPATRARRPATSCSRSRVEPHPVFGRDGHNLTVDLPVTFAEAALGATVAVPTLDGDPVKVRVAPGTPSGRVLRVKGRGVKRGDKAPATCWPRCRSSCRSA